MHAEITAYRGRLVLTLLADHSIPGEVTTSHDNPRFPGQVIYDTAIHLGISDKALQLLRKIQPGNEEVGDLNWFVNDDGKPAFFWRGGRHAIFSIEYCHAARGFDIHPYARIPNRVPEGARAQLDAMPNVYKPKVGLLSGMAL